MNKPDSTRKAELSAPTSEKSAEWEAALPQRSRGSETKIALLLVVVLLGALGFVVYKKMNLKSQTVAQSADFQPVADTDAGAGAAGDDADADNATVWHSDNTAAPDNGQADPWSADGSEQTEPAFAQAEPVTVEWGNAEADNQAAATRSRLEFVQAEPVEPSGAESNAAWDPFSGQEAPVAAENSPGNVAIADNGSGSEAFDPFTGAGEQLEPAGNSNSSPEPSGAEDPFAGGNVAASEADGPVMELFDEDPSDAASEHAADSESAGADPWDLAQTPQDRSVTSSDAGHSTDAEPLLMAPPATEAQPVNTVNPFDVADEGNAQPATAAAEVEFTDERPTMTFDPLPATDDPATEVWSSGPTNAATSDSNPFASASSVETDPFSATSGVSLAASEDEVGIHIVQSGDSFWTISREHYGEGRYFKALAAFNQVRIPDPQTIRPGMKVMVPDAAVLQQRYPQLTGGTYSPGLNDASAPAGFFVERGQPLYRVGKGDTLSDIAHKHLGRASRWIQIYGMNQGQLAGSASLKVGMVLRLPADASQVTAVTAERAGQ